MRNIVFNVQIIVVVFISGRRVWKQVFYFNFFFFFFFFFFFLGGGGGLMHGSKPILLLIRFKHSKYESMAP